MANGSLLMAQGSWLMAHGQGGRPDPGAKAKVAGPNLGARPQAPGLGQPLAMNQSHEP